MKDKKIITQKEKNYIDTLHLSCNLEKFIEGTPLYYEQKSSTTDYKIEGNYAYKIMLEYLFDTMLCNSQKSWVGSGRTWYKLENYTLGILSYDTAKDSNNYNCVIEYNHSHIFPLNKNLDGLDLPFGGSRSDYKIKRIDLTKTAKLEVDYTINHGYISPYRNPPLRPNREKNTIYIGNRNNGNLFRMYPKTIELLTDTEKHPINYSKIALYSEYFGDIENLYSFELELRREYLRGTLGIDSLADLSKVWEANKNIVGRIRFFKDNDKNRKLLEQNNHKRIKAHVLTDYVEFERIQKKKYVTSEEYAIDRSIKVFDTYLDSMGLDRTNDAYMKLFNRAIAKRVDYNNKNIAITFEDTHLSNEIDQMTAKYNLLRENQTNELELEARRHFGEFVSDKNAVAEIKV